MTTEDAVNLDETKLTKFLDQRYGDGLIYMKSPEDRRLFILAISLGMISEQGYLTGYGRQFWANRI